MPNKRFTITMDAYVELDENGMYGGIDFPDTFESLRGVTPMDMLGEWDLLPDLRVVVTDHAYDPPHVFEHIHRGVWKKR